MRARPRRGRRGRLSAGLFAFLPRPLTAAGELPSRRRHSCALVVSRKCRLIYAGRPGGRPPSAAAAAASFPSVSILDLSLEAAAAAAAAPLQATPRGLPLAWPALCGAKN